MTLPTLENLGVEYGSTTDLAEAAAWLRGRSGPMTILTHTKPDGDAFGSAIALTAALRMLGKEARPCFFKPVPASLMHLRGADWTRLNEPDDASLPEAESWIVLDTGAWSQLGPAAEAIGANLERTLLIDHHLSGDIPAERRCIDGRAAANCEIIAELIDHLLGGLEAAGYESELRATMHEALFVGLASDTGWFRFSNTRPQTHELAARLLRCGVDQSALYAVLEQTARPEKLQLLTRALDSLKLLAGEQAAVMVLRNEDFEQTGALQEETESLIDVPQQVETIRLIVLVTETDGQSPLTRLSFRSKPGRSAVNVVDLANAFGGGGHARAAGAKVQAPVEDVLPKLERAIEQAIASSSSSFFHE